MQEAPPTPTIWLPSTTHGYCMQHSVNCFQWSPINMKKIGHYKVRLYKCRHLGLSLLPAY
jgi:hypothetical protein